LKDLYYNVKLVLNPEDYRKLKEASLTIVGAGSIGRNLLLALAGSGVGKFILIDGDKVERRNIPVGGFKLRDVSSYKVSAVKREVRERFGGRVKVVGIPRYSFQIDEKYLLTPEVLVVAVDDVWTRQKINALRTRVEGKKTVFLGVDGFIGSYFLVVSGRTPCWDCFYQSWDRGSPTPREPLKNRKKCPPPAPAHPTPVLPATVYNLVGVTSSEILKIILGREGVLQYYAFNVLESWDMRYFLDNPLKKNPSCPICNKYYSGRDIREYIQA